MPRVTMQSESPPTSARPTPRRFRKLFVAAAVGYTAAVLGATAWLKLGLGDGGAVSLLLVIGPRWPAFVLGLAFLAAALLLRAWRIVALSAVALVVAWFGFMGFNLPALSQKSAAPSDVPLRVMTYNVGRASIEEPWLRRMLERYDPDVLALTECSADPNFASPSPAHHFANSWGLCLFSKHPIVQVDVRDQREAFARYGTAAITRFELALAEEQRLHVLVVHLMTPRPALEAMLHTPFSAGRAVAENLELRRWESEAARQWLSRADGPFIVLGDFNLPVESRIYREVWGDLDNAFSRCGTGFGNTKHTRTFGSRIDHVLMGAGIDCTAAAVVPETISDHKPVLAELTLSAGPP